VTLLNKLLVVLFGVALVGVGLGLLSSGSVSLPTKTPPLRFQFTGPSLLLLGGSPLLLGVLSLALARGSMKRDSRVTYCCVATGMAMLGLAFIIAPKV
jgi:hypothetical protein